MMVQKWRREDPRDVFSDTTQCILVTRPSTIDEGDEVAYGCVMTTYDWHVRVEFREDTRWLSAGDEWDPTWKWIPCPED